MKKSSFVALIMGTVSGVLFALGMCMALLPEWDSFTEGVILGAVGIVLGIITALIWCKMEDVMLPKMNVKNVFRTIYAIVAALVLGYRFNMDRNSDDFARDNFDDIVKNAKNNVHSFARQFAEKEEPKAEEPVSQPRTESAPRTTRPVNVQVSDEGSVDVRDSGDGYHEADIQ